MVAVAPEVARPDVKLHIALQQPSAVISDDGVGEVGPGAGAAPAAVDDLKGFAATGFQGTGRKPLTLPELRQLLLAEDGRGGWAGSDERKMRTRPSSTRHL
jgi:hypothetical protein